MEEGKLKELLDELNVFAKDKLDKDIRCESKSCSSTCNNPACIKNVNDQDRLQKEVLKMQNLEPIISHINSLDPTSQKSIIAYLNYFLVYVFFTKKDFKSAFHQIDKANETKLIRYPAKFHYNIGTIYGFRNEYQKSVEFFKKSIQENPDFELAYFNLGFAYKKLAEFDKSKIEFQRLENLFQKNEKIRCNDPEFWVLRIQNNLYNLNNIDRAIEIINKATDSADFSENSSFHFEAAITYFTKSQSLFQYSDGYFDYLEKAQEHKTAFVNLCDPDHLSAKELLYLSNIYYLDDEFEKALSHAEAGCQLPNSNQDNDIFNAHGQALMKLKKYDEAQVSFEKAFKISKGDGEIRTNLAKSLIKQNLYSQARFELMSVLHSNNKSCEAIKCLINLNVDLADDSDSEEEKGQHDILAYLVEANELCKKLLNECKDELTKQELSHYYYFLGYINCKLFSLKKVGLYLYKAKKYLRKVERRSQYFFEAKKITSLIQEMQDNKDRKSYFILTLGFLVIIFGLFLFFTGKPNIISGYMVDKNKWKESIHMDIPDSIESKFFLSKQEAKMYINNLSDSSLKKLTAENRNELIEKVPKFSHLSKIDDWLVFLTFFAGIVLIVVGVIQEDIKSLKLPGGIALEKRTKEYDDMKASIFISRNRN